MSLTLRTDPTKNYQIMVYAANQASTTDYILIDDLVVVNGPVAPQYAVEYTGAGVRRTGTATILATTTSIAVSHGLYATPSRVFISPTSDTQGKRWWVSSTNSSHIVISIDSSYASGAIDFNWEAAWD